MHDALISIFSRVGPYPLGYGYTLCFSASRCDPVAPATCTQMVSFVALAVNNGIVTLDWSDWMSVGSAQQHAAVTIFICKGSKFFFPCLWLFPDEFEPLASFTYVVHRVRSDQRGAAGPSTGASFLTLIPA